MGSSASEKNGSTLGVALGVTFGAIGVIGIIGAGVFIFLYMKRKKHVEEEGEEEGSTPAPDVDLAPPNPEQPARETKVYGNFSTDKQEESGEYGSYKVIDETYGSYAPADGGHPGKFF